MKKITASLLLITSLLSAYTAHADQVEEATDKLIQNSVTISVYAEKTEQQSSGVPYAITHRVVNSGRGVVVDKKHILTNYHLIRDVVEGKNPYLILAHTMDGRSIFTVIESYDDSQDLALLRLFYDADTFQTAITLAASASSGPFTTIRSQQGHFDNVRYTCKTNSDLRACNALAVNFYVGDSGSGVVNAKGELIGLVFSARFDNNGDCIEGYMLTLDHVQAFLAKYLAVTAVQKPI